MYVELDCWDGWTLMAAAQLLMKKELQSPGFLIRLLCVICTGSYKAERPQVRINCSLNCVAPSLFL